VSQGEENLDERRVTAHLDGTAIDHLLDPVGHTSLSVGIARSAAGQARATARDITACRLAVTGPAMLTACPVS
jgi:hypothetical protein